MSRDKGTNSTRPPSDPIATLQLPKVEGASTIGGPGSPASVSSLCFLGRPPWMLHRTHDARHEEEEGCGDSSDDDDEDLILRTSILTRGESRESDHHTHQVRQAAASVALAGSCLASTHGDGSSFLWDLGKRQIIQQFSPNRGPSLAMRRVDESTSTSKILYHTRDTDGTVSLHDMEASTRSNHVPMVTQFQTGSHSFCAAAPCASNPNLVALPSEHDVVATVCDWRVAPSSAPVAHLHGAGARPSDHVAVLKRQGMLTSLAMSETQSSGRTILACGMEGGSLFLHDLAVPGQPCTSMELSKDPILALDLAPSISSLQNGGARDVDSVVAIAGMAGDAQELAGRPQGDRGTVAVVKSSFDPDGVGSCRLRARLATCELAEAHKSGKPGVAVCRFRPDGRLFAIGGWDRRLRIFDRAACAPLAILKGHAGSVSALDWSPDAAASGVLATGSCDGRIYVWRTFAKA